MKDFEITYGCISRGVVKFQGTCECFLSDGDMEELEQFVIDHDYSPELVDIPTHIYDSLSDDAFEMAIDAFPPFVDDCTNYDFELQMYMPNVLIDLLSEDTRKKVYANMPKEEDKQLFSGV